MALAQDSTMANSTRTQLSTDSLSLFPDNTSQLITPADLRDWITSGIESFVTQKDKSTFENAFYECQSSPITATSGTTNLALATGNFVHITGSGSISITSFGTLPAGSRFVLCFDIAVTLVYNATTMILPGAANIVTAPGDSVMIISEGGGNWRLIGYFPSSGLPVGTVTAVTASAPLSSTGSNAPNLSISQAGASTDGYLSSTDWNTFNNKGNGTVTSVSVNAPLADSGTSTAPNLSIPQANGSTDGFLDSADWTTFNNKQDSLGFTPVPNTRSISTVSPLSGGGDLTADRTISIQDAAADGTTKGAATFAATDFQAASGVINLKTLSPSPAGTYTNANIQVDANGRVTTATSGTGGGITALTGDVTASGTGSVAATIANNAVTTAKILNNNVTYAKIQNASGNSLLLGSNASGTGITEITLGSNLSMSGSTLNATGGGITALTGDVTASGSGSVAATISNDAVTYAKIQNVSTNNRLLGRATAGAGDVEEITLGSNLSFSGTTLNATTGTATLALGTSIVTGATAGRLLLTTTSGANQVLNQDSNLNYDTTNDRLGIGVASPAARLDLASPVAANPSLILAPSSGVTPTGTTNGSIWCDTTSSNTSLTMRKDSAYTKIITLDRNPDFATTGSGVVLSDSVGTLSKGADITALGIYAQTNSISAITTGSGSLIGTVVGSATLPTNFFGVGKTIETKFSGLITMPNGSPVCTIDFRITDGTTTSTLGTLVYDSTNMTARVYIVNTQLTCRTTGAGATFGVSGQMIVNHTGKSQETVFITPGSVAISGSLTTASALTLQVVVTWTGTAGGSIDTRTHFCNYIN